MGYKTGFVLIAMMLATANCLSFCEVENSEVTLFTTQNQIQQLSLDKYVRGYDLEFTSSNESLVSVFEPYHPIAKADVTIKAGYSIVNVDGKNSNTRLWGRQGILFAQGGQKNVSFGYGEFSSGVLPKIESYNYYELPYISNCYSGLIYNENMDTVIDCEKTTANPQQLTDLVCLTFRSGKLTCKSFGSITKTSKRKSNVLTLGAYKFLLSATLTDHISSKFQNETFINVYHIGQDNLEFNLIIDRRTLGLDGLSITDIDIIQFNGLEYVMLTDLNAGLVMFRYTEDNSIDEVTVIPVEGVARQFAQSSQGSWLIATDKHVLDCGYNKETSSLTVLKSYELDPTDSQVTDLQASYLFVAVRTFLGHLYTYDRKHTELKYLLNKEEITENTAITVSPFYPRILQINNTAMVSIAISSGYLYVSQVEKSTDVLILAHSGSTTCVMNIHIELIQNATSKIYQKKVMTSAYRLETNEPLRFVLSDYFGGSNLKYDVAASQKIHVVKEHINSYVQELPKDANQAELLFTKVVEIDDKSYYLTKFTTEYAAFYKCVLTGTKIACNEIDQRIDPKEATFARADGIQRQNGKAFVSWTYSDNNAWVIVKEFGKLGYNMYLNGNVKRYSQVLVAERFMAYVEKELGTLTFLSTEDDKGLITFTKSSFTQAQLASMGGGFYPRQIIDSHNNPNVFYLKFPIAIVAITYLGGRDIEVLSYNKVSDTYVPDDLWEIVVGRNTLLLFVGDSISEYAILADGNLQKLHGIFIGKKPIFPVRYELETDTAYFECEDGSIQYVRLNQPALDSAYYTLQLKKANGYSNWDVSGPWLVSSSGQVYYQFEEPALVIYSTLPDTTYREDLTVGITVSSDTEKKDVKAKVTAFNYPVKIEASDAEDNGLTLPEKGDDQIIPFPVDKYFTGSVANYRIVCPYCLDGNLTLVLPIRLIKQNTKLNGFSAVVGLEDNSGAIVLLKNTLYVVDQANNIVVEKDMLFEGQCSSLGINEGNLIVFCGGSNQHLFVYEASKTAINFLKSYIIPGDANVFKPSEMGVYKNGNTMTVFIHDVDLMKPSARDSNVKVFALGDTIQFKGNLDSSAFELANTDPINSISIKKDSMLVSIGGKGLGYVNLANSQTKGSFVDLENEPALADFTLDDTAYLRVSIYTKSGDTLSALVTTSNSFSYLLQFKISADGKIKFSKLLETYRRYGHQKCLNWGLIDSTYVMLSFYNSETSVETLALYKRKTTGGITDFFTSIQYVIPAEGLKPPKAALLHSGEMSYLFRDTMDKPAASGSLNLYNVTSEFGLLATYDKPSSFEIIQVTASNDYYSVTKDLSVTFDSQQGGIKWYSIVIVCALVAIAVGVAFGFYLKMKRKKADSKKVSLFTENEELDEQV